MIYKLPKGSKVEIIKLEGGSKLIFSEQDIYFDVKELIISMDNQTSEYTYPTPVPYRGYDKLLVAGIKFRTGDTVCMVDIENEAVNWFSSLC